MVITRLPTAKATGPHLREVLWAALGSVRSSRRVPDHVAELVEGLSAFGRCFRLTQISLETFRLSCLKWNFIQNTGF